MKYMNLNNSVNFEKDSKERLNYISNKLKNCILQIKNKENTINPKKSGDNKYTSLADESKLKTNNKYQNSTPYFNKNKFNKTPKYYQTIFYKRMNNYNDIIHDKKNELLNINSLLNKRFQRNSNYGTLYSLKIKSSDENKDKNYFSFDEKYSNKNKIISNNSSIDNEHKHKNANGALNNINWNKRNKKNKMVKLEYEFEIRRLKRKLEKIKKENFEIKDKLNDIKEKNINLEKKILNDDEQKSILKEIILLNKQNAFDNPNGIDIKYDNQSKKDNDSDSFDELILNIMDIKYYYENSLLTNEFINGVNKLLYGIPLYINGNKNTQNLIKSINELINIKSNTFYINNKYRNLLQDNYNYYLFLNDLKKKLNLNEFSELDKLIKNIYFNMKNNEKSQKFQNVLVKNFSSTQKNNEKNKLYGSSNLILNNKKNYKINHYTKLQNYLNANKGISRDKQKNIINHFDKKNKKSLDNYLSQTEKNDSLSKNNTVRNKNDSLFNINNYYQTFYNKKISYEDKKKKKINLNYLDKDIKINKNNNSNNNEKSNDFKYNNSNIGYVIEKTYNKDDDNLYKHAKNHSTLFFNK